jgi:branched-chain amino acid aminotransferase
MGKYCYYNGKYTMTDKVQISPYDLGVLRGYGVFDVMCTKNSKPFFLRDHWKRLQNSAQELQLKIPVTEKEFEKIIIALIKKNGHKESGIRTVLTGGISPDAFSIGQETFYILIEKFNPLPKKIFEKGAKIMTLEYRRHHPHAKITNYVMAIKNLKKKKQVGALEILYTKNGQALEASTSNIFLVKKGKIITPVDDILYGITRKVAIEVAQKAGYEVIERKVKTEEIFSADELFLSASNKDIVPVVKVDGKNIGDGKPGNITKKIMAAFQKFCREY